MQIDFPDVTNNDHCASRKRMPRHGEVSARPGEKCALGNEEEAALFATESDAALALRPM
jgi:hypothetical protein